ncbi:hypothetical protein HNQ99_000470 [Rhizorhapis suberifaciens]|uniref:Uncharacterized protein n=1 Tax=Rhizorhapis suberifaciens TaxID=13656 RepID=A0A840HQ49_9SPHN|nr:hypothetical protein [Rhizorhapis suberifaciens]
MPHLLVVVTTSDRAIQDNGLELHILGKGVSENARRPLFEHLLPVGVAGVGGNSLDRVGERGDLRQVETCRAYGGLFEQCDYVIPDRS